MSGIPPSPLFFRQPLRYLKWASINKPAYFYSIIVGCIGPVMVVTVPPIRRYMGEEQIQKIPMTYPGTYGEIEGRMLELCKAYGTGGRNMTNWGEGQWRGESRRENTWTAQLQPDD
jgi:hypothetical protein